MWLVKVMVEGKAVSSHPLRGAPLLVGRGGANDLMLLDHAVSSRHLAVFTAGGRVVVEDLGSRNGTLLDGEPVVGRAPWPEGSEVTLGGVTLTLERMITEEAGPLGLVLEDLEAGVRHPIREDRFRIGGAAGCELVVPGAAEEAAVLVVQEDGEVALARDDDMAPLEPDTPVEIAGRRWAIRWVGDTVAATHDLQTTRYPYRLMCRVDPAAGAVARIEEPARGRHHAVGGENRCTLLYVLARQRAQDLAAGIPDDQAGWVGEADVATGIWGRAGASRNVNVVVCRTRKELREAGFDPWFLEKSRRRLRVRLAAVEVT